MSPLSWDRYFQLALASYAVGIASFVGSERARQGGPVTWQSNALLVVSGAFLCTALILTGLTFTQRPNSLLQKISKWIRRKRRERKQAYYLMTAGSHSRDEEGDHKLYRKGDLIGLTDEQVERFGRDRIEGPIDVKAWKRQNQKKGKDPASPG